MSEAIENEPVVQATETRTTCRICTELHQFIDSAKEEAAPHLALGLTEAGLRNREHQRKEKILKSEADLARHLRACLISKA